MDTPLLIKTLKKLGHYRKVSKQNFNEGPPNFMFIDVVIWLSSELVNLCGLESRISCVTDSEDTLGFLVEVSSLLKELYCPYKSLISGQITERLINSDDKKLLVTYLCTELQAAKIQTFKNPKKRETPMKIDLNESKIAKELRKMLICLRLPMPSETVIPQQLFEKVEKELKQFSQPLTPREKVGELLFSGCLTEKQWIQLEQLYNEMKDDYKNRRYLLLTRLDVTVKSFLWSDRVKEKSEEVIKMYNKRKCGILLEPLVKISHILSAKPDLTIIEKTSNASVRKNTKSTVNNVVIGDVPDRGGRPEEQQRPPPEVPSWQKNDSYSRGIYKRFNARLSASAAYGYKNYRYSHDKNCQLRNPIENVYQGDMSRDNYNKVRMSNYNNSVPPPVYQPVNYRIQIGAPQCGFGGYLSTGDNFQQYGTVDGITPMNQYQSTSATGRSRNRSRGGYSDRGSNQFRGDRGPRRGRNHY